MGAHEAALPREDTLQVLRREGGPFHDDRIAAARHLRGAVRTAGQAPLKGDIGTSMVVLGRRQEHHTRTSAPGKSQAAPLATARLTIVP
eukprot:5540422-Prymnesium_polylepis.2